MSPGEATVAREYPAELCGGRLTKTAWGDHLATTTTDWYDGLCWMMAGRDVDGPEAAPAGGKESPGGDYVEVQSEYFVPLAKAKQALEAVYAVASQAHWGSDVEEDPGVATCEYVVPMYPTAD